MSSIVVDGKEYARIRLGEEHSPEESPCPACGAYYFDEHVPGCEIEECPACGGALARCGCADAPHGG